MAYPRLPDVSEFYNDPVDRINASRGLPDLAKIDERNERLPGLLASALRLHFYVHDRVRSRSTTADFPLQCGYLQCFIIGE